MSFVGYLASPYAHPDPKVRERRYRGALETVRDNMLGLSEGKTDISLFSPIVHSHVAAVDFCLPSEWSFWRMVDFPMLEKADILFVLALPGWMDSKGVGEELAVFRAMGRPYLYITGGEFFRVEGRSFEALRRQVAKPPIESVKRRSFLGCLFRRDSEDIIGREGL